MSGNVSGTAFVIAAFRAEENAADSPLYRDEVVELFLTPELRETAAAIAQNFPAAREMIKLRTRYFDNALSHQIEAGFQQVVLLGSGLDTRSIRKNIENITYFEIDSRATLQLKQDVFSQRNLNQNATYIPGDYVKDGLIALLQKNKFDFDSPTYFIWEGNTTLLTQAAVITTIEAIRDHFQTFRLSFDYMAEKVITRTTGYDDINDYIDRYEKLYTPWITGFDTIEPLAERLGLQVVENFSTADLFERYRPHHSLSSNLFKFYFVCTLERKFQSS